MMNITTAIRQRIADSGCNLPDHYERGADVAANPIHRESHADELIAEYILVSENRGDVEDARLARYGVPVWALVGYLPAAHGNLGEIADAYQLPLDAVLAAFAFYAHHKSAIDVRIAANAAPGA